MARLAGHERAAAYVSALALLIFLPFGVTLGFLIWAPGGTESAVMAAINDLALWVWIAAFAVVVLDLERRLEPPVAAGRRRYARAAIAVALVMPAALIVAQVLLSSLFSLLTNELTFVGTILLVAAYFLIFEGIGISLVVCNDEARRTGLLQGPLPWLGTLIGPGYMVAAIGLLVALVVWMAPDQLWNLFVAGWLLLVLANILYIAWAVWIGTWFGGHRQPHAKDLRFPPR